ncbi:MAG TPA: type II toxin-antitoxin system PemK/MazF family toxin [Anaerolineaceae bacterium]|nr:type II toxin-antitoxin system PemK/MazF family toxin [Anaerolineaceae bacterium]
MRRGEIWSISLDPTVGAEIQKTRPAVIVSSDAVGVLPLRVIVPLTDWKDRYEQAAWMVQISPDKDNGLSKTSAADAFQIRSASTTRFVRKLGRLSPDDLDTVVAAVGLVIEYSSDQ